MITQKIKTSFKIGLLIIAILITACGDDENSSIKDRDTNDMNNSCEFENPLTDLPWLKAKVDEITLIFQGNPLHIAIYQCTYGNEKTGFLEDRCNVSFFYDCEGETLCMMGGFAGATCPHLNIDFENKTLIWEINN